MTRSMAVICLLGCLVATSAQSAEVFRADFEELDAGGKPKGWAFRSAAGECAGTVDASEPQGGHSIRLHIPKGDKARAHWSHEGKTPLKPSTGYRLTMRAMAGQVEGKRAEAYLILYENGVQAATHWHTTTRLKGTVDWHDQVLEFVTRPDTTHAVLACKLRYGTGYAWFDDITIAEADVETFREKHLQPPPGDGSALQIMWTPAQWCRDDGEMRLLRGLVNPYALFFWGKREALKDPVLVLTAEEGLAIHGPIVCGRMRVPKAADVQPERCERDGAKCLRWRFPVPMESLRKMMKPDKPHWSGYHFLYFEPTDKCPKTFQLDWQIENSGRPGPTHSLQGAVAEMDTKRLAPQPHFRIGVQHTGGLRHPDPAIRKRLMDYLMCAGMRGGLSLTYWVPEDAPADEEFRKAGFDLHTWQFYAYGSLGQTDHPLIKEDGSVWKGRICPTALTRKPQPFYRKLVEYYRRKLATGLKTVIIDYEPPVHDVCFCPTCRKEFAKHANLPSGEIATLAAKEIFAKYDPQWGAFRAWQNGVIVKMLVGAIHEVDPEVKVGLCSSSRNPYTVSRGMDIALFEPAAAFHTPMIYTKGARFHDLVQPTCEGTHAPVRPFLELSDISQPRCLTPQELRMNMLATALCGGKGAFMWVGLECFDAEYMMKIRQTYLDANRFGNHLAHAKPSDELVVEPMFDSERLVTVDGRALRMTTPEIGPFVRWHVWKSDGRYVVGALNYDKKRSYGIKIRAAGVDECGLAVEDMLGTAQSLSSDPAAGVMLRIPPEDAVVVLLRKKG